MMVPQTIDERVYNLWELSFLTEMHNNDTVSAILLQCTLVKNDHCHIPFDLMKKQSSESL